MKNSDWNITDNRFVAFLDLLGFKDKVMRKSHNDIYEELLKISKITKTIEKDIRKLNQTDINIVSFSDSIIIFSKNDTFNHLESFLLCLRGIFSYAIRENIALKGGFAHGKISVNIADQIYFGKPIIDAYLMEEDVNYLGVVAHYSIDSYLINNEDLFINSQLCKKLIFKERTNLKSGQIVHWNLDWFMFSQRNYYDLVNNEDKIERIKIGIESFYSSVSGSPRRYIDNTVDLLYKAFNNNKLCLERVLPIKNTP